MKKWCDLYCEYARFAKQEALDGSGSCRKFQAIWCEKLGRHVTKNAACEVETGTESKPENVEASHEWIYQSEKK